MKNKREEILSPVEIKSLRKILKLTQEQAARICGGGPNAFSRYESGKVRPSKATCNLLLFLAKHPEEIRLLLERTVEQTT
ncbi:MAG: type II TA system antitoxin MqsA family protein [Gammaproteobacteria bacterium]